MWENDRINRKPRYRVAPGNWNDWRSQTRSFEDLAARMALGARRGDIVRMMIASGARLGLIGIAAGVAVSLATSRILNGLLFGVERTDAVTYASVIVLMLVAALLACAIPAMRAARVNPLSAIRAE